ncbi:5-hydroxytryptamine receptor 2A isoform X2 [Eupeodes corollae]|uniref:5-hydroxytryptamine receptor 2A isoform X2 n=1 Tax=Eupeodes corollae TaxID=290404 RepID=UPI00249143BA|nr:5-hydroxytryptamine receptor 2A isoform X2 [Eupeodes corollae]
MSMETKTLLRDAFGYVFIDNGSPDSYLISNEVDSYFLNNTTLQDANIGTLFNDSNNGSNSNANLFLFNTSINQSGLFDNNNETDTTAEDIAELIRMAFTSVLLGLMILITIIGNVFVIAAIILERNLQNVANYLVASLAVADLFVACLVMPLGAVYEISQGWILGPELCDIWTSCDVLCCTASILHLVAIATDRYWAVTNIDYMHSRTSKRVFIMIFLVWFCSVIVSLAPQFGWKDPEYLQRIEQQKCMVSQDVSYQVFATCCTFYVPLTVILVLYWKIYQTARKRIHRRRPRPIDVSANNNQPALSQKKRNRLKLRIGKCSDKGKSAASSLGLVEGISTNTVNTVEDTEFSSSNMDSKSRGFTEAPTSSTSQISTVSHLVAIANQTANKTEHNQNLQQQQNQPQQMAQTPSSISTSTSTSTSTTITTTATAAVAATTDRATVIPSDVLEEPHHELSESHSHPAAIAAQPSHATTSTATTITSISALSPQTPINPTGGTVAATGLSSSSNQVTPVPQNKQSHQNLSSIPNPQSKVTKRKETLEAKRERKAAKTLAIITGAFVVCWLPFFLMALLLPLCEDCNFSDAAASFFLWLGYFNSTLNPVIYTIFSPEFRQAFKRILFGGHRPVHYRSGKI